ncbi:MAG: hypothetical protein HOP15_17870 [Planctomycetes bacterium]|nr:hypothetical protein [Planctomycetota bacterium]
MVRFWIDPALAEEALFERMRMLESAGGAEARLWQREREAIYDQCEASARAAAFVELAGAWFERLDLAQPLRAALALTPHVRAKVTEIRLHRVARRAQEGSELYREAELTRLVFGLSPARFGDSTTLSQFFLGECLYAEDMLDPGVGFSPELDPAHGDERARTELVRDRLRVLWEARVRGRAAALLGAEVPLRPPPAFARAFAGVCGGVSAGDSESNGIRVLHQRASEGALATFPQLLAAARGELDVLQVGVPASSEASSEPAAVRAAHAAIGSRP